MYIPQHWHWVLPVLVILTSFAIYKRTGGGWDVILFVMWPLLRIAIEWAAYLHEAGVAYQNYVTRGAPSVKPEVETPDFGPGFIPTKRAIMQTSAQVVSAPRINAEQKVARTLIDQRNHNMDIDLTEGFWIKRGNFDGTRQEFVDMKEKWVKRDVIYKTGSRKNAPHDVKDWRKVRLIADGHELPN